MLLLLLLLWPVVYFGRQAVVIVEQGKQQRTKSVIKDMGGTGFRVYIHKITNVHVNERSSQILFNIDNTCTGVVGLLLLLFE